MSIEGEGPARTALIVPVPAAEPVIGRHRQRLDPSAAWGVPAHVTVLFPFVGPELVSSVVLGRIDACLRGVSAFEFGLERTRWFDDEVVWLAPEPVEPFLGLIGSVYDEFPECPPYGGAHTEAVPHVTIGQRGPEADLADLRRAEDAVTAGLPIRTRADTVLLMTGRRSPSSWRVMHTFSLRVPAG